MKPVYKIILSVISLILIFGCEPENQFLESDFNGVISVNKVHDFDLLLNNVDLTSESYGENYPNTHMSDDINLSDDSLRGLGGSFFAAYAWKSFIYPQGTDPLSWSLPYKKTFTYNTIINEIDQAKDATNSSKTIKLVKKLKAEALLGRAFEHLSLVNLYTQPYSDATVGTPGIPYMTFADVTQDIPPRETLADTYAKIEADLLTAIPNLPDLYIENSTRGSKIAAYGVLARMYLYMQKYDKVIEYTEKALLIKNNLQDYTQIGFSLPFNLPDNVDTVFSRSISQGNLAFKTPSSDLLNLYSSEDARNNVYFEFGLFGFAFFGTDYGISIPELILTRAEALARKNQLVDALSLLNNLRTKRINSVVALSSSNQEEVLKWVLEERRRDLVNRGLRFADMRRLQLEGRIGTVTHTLFNGALATLKKGSPRYTLAIPEMIINLNPGMKQNPR